MFMNLKNVKKNIKASKVIVTVATAMTGVLMLFFQNCGQISAVEVSDLAGDTLVSRELGSVSDSDNIVSAQILQDDGTIILVDQNGNESVQQNNQGQQQVQQPQVQQPQAQQPQVQQPVVVVPVQPTDVPVIVDESDNDDLDVCEAYDVKTSLAAAYQKIKCKKQRDNKHRDRRHRCVDLIRGNGVTVIDIANFKDFSTIESVKGKTIFYSSDPNRSNIKGLVIEHAVGKTILCGISVARLDVKKGNLELREGASVKSCGTIRGKIRKDAESSIDGALTEE